MQKSGSVSAVLQMVIAGFMTAGSKEILSELKKRHRNETRT